MNLQNEETSFQADLVEHLQHYARSFHSLNCDTEAFRIIWQPSYQISCSTLTRKAQLFESIISEKVLCLFWMYICVLPCVAPACAFLFCVVLASLVFGLSCVFILRCNWFLSTIHPILTSNNMCSSSNWIGKQAQWSGKGPQSCCWKSIQSCLALLCLSCLTNSQLYYRLQTNRASLCFALLCLASSSLLWLQTFPSFTIALKNNTEQQTPKRDGQRREDSF